MPSHAEPPASAAILCAKTAIGNARIGGTLIGVTA
jgi:hypothetical protein